MELTTCLWFNGRAREAANFYSSIFPNSSVADNWIAPTDTPGNQQGEEVVVNIESLDIGNTIKSVSLLGLDQNELTSESINWQSSESLSNLISYTTASVVGKLSSTFEGWLPTMHYVSGSESGSLITTHKEKLLIKENDTFKFKFVSDITNTDLLVISNEKIAEMTSIHLEWYSGSIVTINIEPDDVLVAGTNLNEIGTNSLGSIITHNRPEKI